MNFSNRISRIILLAHCLIRAVFYGPANKITTNISRIIVVPTGKLGDVICATPVLAALRTHLPKTQIIVAGNSKLHRPLLNDSGLADDYLDLEESNRIERIKGVRAQVAIVTGPSFESAALFYLAGIPLIIGPTVVGGEPLDLTRSYKILKSLLKTFPHRMYEYAPRERLKALDPLGIISSDTRKHLGFSEKAEMKARDLITKIKAPYLIGIAAGAGNKEKQWPPNKFAEVANYLIKKHGAHIIVSGSIKDALESAQMMAAIEDKSKITDATSVTLDELKALIAKLDLFISVNTGPLYIAEAFDIPTVDILGPVNPWDQPPQGKIHKMVLPPGKPEPLLLIMNSRHHDKKEAIRIAESTRLEDVITATEEALQEVNQRKSHERIKKE